MQIKNLFNFDGLTNFLRNITLNRTTTKKKRMKPIRRIINERHLFIMENKTYNLLIGMVFQYIFKPIR
jgi:hypothetical protein